MKKLLSIPEAAEVLSCTASAIKKWLCQGRLDRVPVGSLARLRASDLEAVVKNGLPPKGTYRRNHATKGLPAS